MDARMLGTAAYTLQPALPMAVAPAIVRHHRRSDSCAAKPQVSPSQAPAHAAQASIHHIRRQVPVQQCRRRSIACASGHRELIQGYTPANYISFTDEEEHRCHHALAIEVQAPASVCFGLWNDWCRLVEFMDLVAQIGLDPSEPQLGLFQCFYRWGRMPVMEIVFLAEKVHVDTDKLIAFQTVWGMPARGEIEFMPNESGDSTTIVFRLEHQLPWLLVDLKVGTLAVEAQLRDIFSENLQSFKELAEATAQEPGSSAGPAKAAASTQQQPAGQGPSSGQAAAAPPSKTPRDAKQRPSPASSPPVQPASHTPPPDSLGSNARSGAAPPSSTRKSGSTSRGAGTSKSSSKSRGRSRQPNPAA